jgi:hypothetical protein
MAKQKGIIKIDGTLGDITFYQTKDGYLVREKGSLTAQRISSRCKIKMAFLSGFWQMCWQVAVFCWQVAFAKGKKKGR